MRTRTRSKMGWNEIETAQNKVTISQISKRCGEICMTCATDETELTPALVLKMEAELRAAPDHQESTYEILLTDQHGKELDFELNFLPYIPEPEAQTPGLRAGSHWD